MSCAISAPAVAAEHVTFYYETQSQNLHSLVESEEKELNKSQADIRAQDVKRISSNNGNSKGVR